MTPGRSGPWIEMRETSVQVLAHGDWHERTARPRLGDHRLDALLGQRDQPAERVQGRAQIVGLLAHDQDPVGLAVARERHAVTVEHAAALRRQQPVIDPVLIRKERVLIGSHHLQVVEPPGERGEQARLSAAEQQRPTREHAHPVGFTVHRSAAGSDRRPG